MALLIEGKHCKQIASAQGVKHHTIVTRYGRIRRKLGARNREQAALFFARAYGD